MSGGGLGQIANAIPIDEKHQEVVIYAGNNEVTKTRTNQEFVYTVETAGEKLKKISTETKVIVVLPTVPTVGACDTGRARYLEEKLKEIKEIKVIKLDNIEYESDHPSQKGTLNVIEQIHKEIGDEIILDGAKDDVTTNRWHSQVQAIYRAGCRGCTSEEYTPDLCMECKTKSNQVYMEYLE